MLCLMQLPTNKFDLKIERTIIEGNCEELVIALAFAGWCYVRTQLA